MRRNMTTACSRPAWKGRRGHWKGPEILGVWLKKVMKRSAVVGSPLKRWSGVDQVAIHVSSYIPYQFIPIHILRIIGSTCYEWMLIIYPIYHILIILRINQGTDLLDVQLEPRQTQVKSSEQGWYSELELPPVGCCSLSLEEQTTAAAARDHSWWRKKEKPLCQERLGAVAGSYGDYGGWNSPDFRKRSKFGDVGRPRLLIFFRIFLETQPVAMFGEAFLPRFPGAGALGDGGGTSGRAEGDGPRGMVPWDELFSSGFLWDPRLINFRRKPC